ncbi:hypothetical protein KR009_004880 [Drosophila setifemur]|nr:hypothetical protein KR009_004880 [Drosophila setifemur]
MEENHNMDFNRTFLTHLATQLRVQSSINSGSPKRCVGGSESGKAAGQDSCKSSESPEESSDVKKVQFYWPCSEDTENESESEEDSSCDELPCEPGPKELPVCYPPCVRDASPSPPPSKCCEEKPKKGCAQENPCCMCACRPVIVVPKGDGTKIHKKSIFNAFSKGKSEKTPKTKCPKPSKKSANSKSSKGSSKDHPCCKKPPSTPCSAIPELYQHLCDMTRRLDELQCEELEELRSQMESLNSNSPALEDATDKLCELNQKLEGLQGQELCEIRQAMDSLDQQVQCLIQESAKKACCCPSCSPCPPCPPCSPCCGQSVIKTAYQQLCDLSHRFDNLQCVDLVKLRHQMDCLNEKTPNAADLTQQLCELSHKVEGLESGEMCQIREEMDCLKYKVQSLSMLSEGNGPEKPCCPEKPSCPEKKKSCPEKKNPCCPEKKKNSCPEKKNPCCPEKKNPCCPEKKKPSCPKEKNPCCPEEKNPCCPEKKNPCCPEKKNPCCPQKKNPCCPKEKNPCCPKEKKPSCPEEKKPCCPKKKKSCCLEEKKPSCLEEKKPSCPEEKNPCCPEKNPWCPEKKNPCCPEKKKPCCPEEKKPSCPEKNNPCCPEEKNPCCPEKKNPCCPEEKQEEESCCLLKKPSSTCQFCRGKKMPVLNKGFYCHLTDVIGTRCHSDVVISIHLRADNVYHVCVRDLTEGGALGCFLVTDDGIEEARCMGLFQKIVTFTVIDVRSTVRPKQCALGFTFEYTQPGRQCGGSDLSTERVCMAHIPFVGRVLGIPQEQLKHIHFTGYH